MRIFIAIAAALAALCLACPATAQTQSAVRLNQLGFLPDGAKHAIIVTDAAGPIDWEVRDESGATVARGRTRPFGMNGGSGETVHRADFSALTTPGRGYTLHAGGAASHPFRIDEGVYRRLKYDALAFFYHQRASIEIEARFVGERWARPAANAPDTATCFRVDQRGNDWGGCPYTLDVSRGWYDAGDHGKYLVNSGIAVWTLLNYYERARQRGVADFGDGMMAIPEAGNGVPDLLDEVRWNLEFMLAMQVPQGTRLRLPRGNQTATIDALRFTEVDASGMGHHKMSDVAWTPLPTPPHLNASVRELAYPSTAATLNLAAVAAQCARVWAAIDAAFAARCLEAARRAYDAAERVPDVLAYNVALGSGAYGDSSLSDEFYWAAAELYLTTGEARYGRAIRRSSHWLEADEFGWPRVATLGTISLATAGQGADRDAARRAIVARADALRAETQTEGYLIAFSRSYVWGSNSDFVNRAIVFALAHEYTGARAYRDEAINMMDYILGRNPLDQSYVAGYGARPMSHPHHRFWAPSRDPSLPPPPPGTLSGGANFNQPADDVARRLYAHCRPQTCWEDNVEAYSLNEVAINWNAPLFWVAAYLDEPLP